MKKHFFFVQHTGQKTLSKPKYSSRYFTKQFPFQAMQQPIRRTLAGLLAGGVCSGSPLKNAWNRIVSILPSE